MDRSRFPWWVVCGALVIAAGYLPTVRAPFDFIDDGNLVYPAPPGTTLGGHVERWWDRVKANYEHLGPFRPVLWAHWEVAANLFDADPLPWRVWRLAWCGLSAGMLLWLLRELNLRPAAARVAAAAAMWNPYRNEIWTSLTLGEGVAMPYAVFALVAARKAAHSPRPLAWELASMFGVVMALGCKNTFAALIPAQVMLRLLPDGVPLRDAWRANRVRALALTLTLALPAAHFVYFKMNWHPGQYTTAGPTLAQAGRIVSAIKGAAGLDFLAVGIVLTVLVLARSWGKFPTCLLSNGKLETCPTRAPLLCAALLLTAGFAAYLPMSMMSGRYTLPAVWGFDILFAVALSALSALPASLPKRVAWAGVWAGVIAVCVASVGRQEKIAARSRMLNDAVAHVIATAPPDAVVGWVCGDLNVEEGIHFRWHLLHRGRPDVHVALLDADGRPVKRVELDPPSTPPTLLMAGTADGVRAGHTFAVRYWFGRREYACHLSRAGGG